MIKTNFGKMNLKMFDFLVCFRFRHTHGLKIIRNKIDILLKNLGLGI
jgi:hypothetical protein